MPRRSASDSLDARVVDLALRHQPLRGGQCGHRAVVGGVAARLRRDRDRAEHRQQDRDAVLLRTLDATQHVRLGDVRDFVRHHRGDLVLALGRQHQAGIGADVTADRGERVDLPVLQHEEGEILTRLVAGCAEAVAERAQPAIDQGIFEHVVVVAQLGQQHFAVLLLLGRAEHFARRRADVGQAVLLRGREKAGEEEGRGGGGQKRAHAGLAGRWLEAG